MFVRLLKNYNFLLATYFICLFALIILPLNPCFNYVAVAICTSLYVLLAINILLDNLKLIEKVILIYGVVIGLFIITFLVFLINKKCI